MNLIFTMLAAAAVASAEPAPAVQNPTQNPASKTARITARTTYYDRKEGVAHFSGNVFVNDNDYQLHADSAFAFMGNGATNELSRIVALGHISMTNATRRAYGQKVSYYRQPGLVVLHGDANTPAEVWEETTDGVRKVRGRKIKFWIGSEQVEVVDADISAPSKGNIGELKSLGR